MARGSADKPPAKEWKVSAGRSLHRAAARTAAGVAGQFRASLAPDAESAPKRGRIDGKVLNVRPDPVDFRDAVYEASLIELATYLFPKPLADLGLEARNQGTEGSCTGQALAAVLDMQNAPRRRDGAIVPARVSARMLYESARAFDEFADDDLPGSSVRGVIKGFFHRGVCGSDLAPYFPGDVGWRLDVDMAKEARRVTLGAYLRLRHVLNDYHAALSEARALLCSSMIHEGWSEQAVDAAGGVIRTPSRDAKQAELIGAHAFAIVGYTPEGFLVLNSFGAGWGGYTSTYPGEEKGVPMPGIALWPYEDWQDHVLDTWVLRLQAPANLPSGFTGGYHLVRRPTALRDDPLMRAAGIGSVPAMNVAGHFVNIAEGCFAGAPPYENDESTFKETARLLLDNQDRARDGRYEHLLLYAHGGLNDLDAAARRAAAMTPVFKANGVYPVFFHWHTGLGETIADLLRRLFGDVSARAGGFTDFSDTLLENSAQRFARPVWREMKADARRSFAKPDGSRGGDAWAATRFLADAAQARTKHPMRLHLAGHSAGALFLGEMLARARDEKHPLLSNLATVSLFAPACTNAFFDENLAPAAAAISGEAADAFAIYNLTDADEQDDSVGGLYRKSLLYLVSNILEDAPATPLAGLEARRGQWPEVEFILSDPRASPASSPASRSRTHGGFDEDPDTMNHVLARILGRARITDDNGGFSQADLGPVSR